MSWSRKSEYGWKDLKRSAGEGESPVVSVAAWQLLQPVVVKTRRPRVTAGLTAPRGGGPRKVMKSRKATTPSPSSLTPGRGLHRRRVQSPWGQDSSGNSGW